MAYGGMNGGMRSVRVYPRRSRGRQQMVAQPVGVTGSSRGWKARIAFALPLARSPAADSSMLATATTRLRNRIDRWLNEEGLQRQVSRIEECPADGTVTVMCSSQVKRRLRTEFLLLANGKRS